ncbi:MAG: CoA-binding protein [Vicinamibacterales bacterium]
MGKVVAVVGASADRRKFGNKAVRAFQAAGYQVVPINPSGQPIEGLVTYRSVMDVPQSIQMVTVYVPADVAIRLLPDFVSKGIEEVWLNPGADDDELVAAARQRGLRVIVACSIIGTGQRPGDF